MRNEKERERQRARDSGTISTITYMQLLGDIAGSVRESDSHQCIECMDRIALFMW
jgi:hypothetical protein